MLKGKDSVGEGGGARLEEEGGGARLEEEGGGARLVEEGEGARLEEGGGGAVSSVGGEVNAMVSSLRKKMERDRMKDVKRRFDQVSINT